jgi:hypothetical protein
MTGWMMILRMAANIPMIIGAWYHIPWLFLVGMLMILFGWLRGVILPRVLVKYTQQLVFYTRTWVYFL